MRCRLVVLVGFGWGSRRKRICDSWWRGRWKVCVSVVELGSRGTSALIGLEVGIEAEIVIVMVK
jgi:hypothetical protein